MNAQVCPRTGMRSTLFPTRSCLSRPDNPPKTAARTRPAATAPGPTPGGAADVSYKNALTTDNVNIIAQWWLEGDVAYTTLATVDHKRAFSETDCARMQVARRRALRQNPCVTSSG
ncbi:hypothetical protein Zmor_004826 [Zophobas morio]|uniref:Uncharacterized protein n=1 Tax=Zophobas morio TaxID=2755281 RepID=A0AA38IS14_9CUCU|nr:hypothetical protein Zmor_004826 [Zophobas morio]